MNMRKFRQNKLWRDKTFERLKAQGSVFQVTPLTDDATFDHHLRLKLLEETQEVCATQNRRDLIEELADLTAVIDALCTLHTISHTQIAALREQKCAKEGEWANRLFVTTVEHPEDSYSAQLCLAQPDRYPEIKD